MCLTPSSGIAAYAAGSRLIIRFVRHGCTNRPFFHLVVSERKAEQFDPIVEQVGTFDSMPNEHSEKLLSLDFDRIRYWMGKGADVSKPVAELLGIAGLAPIHPRTYMWAWRNRQAAEQRQQQAADEKAQSSN